MTYLVVFLYVNKTVKEELIVSVHSGFLFEVHYTSDLALILHKIFSSCQVFFTNPIFSNLSPSSNSLKPFSMSPIV
jgi:hypothetical protein